MQRVFILALSMPYMGIALQAKHALRTARRLPPRSRALASGELNDDATIYHIPEGPPHPNLKATVVKHLRHRNTFIERHKPSEHTLEALDVARQFVADFYSRRHHEESADVGEGDNFQSKALPVILDSGCGTGRSSAILAAAYPHMPVLGLDRSLARIAKNKFYNRVTNVGREAREGAALAGASEDDYGEDVSNRNDKRSLEAPDESNLLLLRCDVVDFWRGADAEVANQRWHVPLHTILYPNPYPKAKHLSARWHGHPCWPDLLLVCADVLLLRASWKQYLDEFSSAVEITGDELSEADFSRSVDVDPVAAIQAEREANRLWSIARRYRPAAVAGPHLLGAGDFNKGQPLTNFEAKYIASGQPTYELLLGFSEGEMGDEAKSDEGAGYFFP